MNTLQRELFIIASKPEAKLSPEERKIFTFYIERDFSESAEHGCFSSIIYENTPESILNCLKLNGFEFKTESYLGKARQFASWKNAKEGTLAFHFKEVAEDPMSGLSSLEQTQYLEFTERAQIAAKEGKFSIQVSDSMLPEVRKALGLQLDSKEFSWAFPENSNESVPVPYSVE